MGSVHVLADDGDAAVVLDSGVDDDALVRPGDDASAVGAEDPGLRDGGEALADPHVEVVQRRGAQLDEDVVGAWFGVGCILVAEHLGPAVVVDPHRLHPAPSWQDGTSLVAMHVTWPNRPMM